MKKISSAILLLLALVMIVSFPTHAAKKTVKEKWKTIDGDRYYIKKDGSYAKKSYQISGTYYVFDLKGKLIRPKKNALVQVGKNKFYVDTKGRAISGWQIIKNNLYYATVKGRIRAGVTCQGISLSKSGAAVNDTAAKLKIQTMQVMASIANDSMTQEQKLRQAWYYMVSRGRFFYAGKYPAFSMKSWQKATAYDTLTSQCGNCYSFACAFSALAAEIGYQPYVVCGRVTGNRDGAGDGYTRHAWVQINGLYYDPEAQFAGWAGGIYGSGGYPVGHSIQQRVDFINN